MGCYLRDVMPDWCPSQVFKASPSANNRIFFFFFEKFSLGLTTLFN